MSEESTGSAEQITLGNVGKGRAAEMFDDMVKAIVTDIAQDDKDVEDERSFTLKFTFLPQEDGVVYARIEKSIKLAKHKPIAESFQMDSGGNLWQQKKLPELPGMENVTNINEGKKEETS